MNVQEVLKEAQERFGFKNQIIVAAEELNELSCAILKYARYEDHEKALEKTREKVLEEYADAIIVLNHISMIYDLGQMEIDMTITQKMERMERWLASGKGFEQTTVDRKWKNE